MKYIYYLLALTLFFSCKPTTEKKATYFGGQIINPKASHVLLLKDDEVIETIELDANSKFIKEFENLDEGLYTFKHANEFQYIYIEPTDSILIRLNTWDFDESLVFSGNGAAKNEYLINLFLQNEKEEKVMYSYFGLDEALFSAKLDSLITVRNNLFSDFKETLPELTSGFVNIANAAITYPIYRLKEIYPYYYKKSHNLDEFPKLSPSFYSYRENVNINDTALIPLYSYQNYIVSYLYNQTFQKVEHLDSDDDDFVLHLMDITSDKVKIEELKNTILQKIVIDDFLHSSSTCTINQQVYDKFKTSCTNQEIIEHVNSLVKDTQFIKQDSILPNFEVVNANGRRFEIANLIKDKNTVLYFWNINYMSSEYLYKRINYLEKKLPQIQFIGINISNDYNVTNEPYLKKLDANSQFTLPANSTAHQFLTSNYPRTILINNKGVVTNGFILLNSKKLWGELIKLEKN